MKGRDIHYCLQLEDGAALQKSTGFECGRVRVWYACVMDAGRWEGFVECGGY